MAEEHNRFRRSDGRLQLGGAFRCEVDQRFRCGFVEQRVPPRVSDAVQVNLRREVPTPWDEEAGTAARVWEYDDRAIARFSGARRRQRSDEDSHGAPNSEAETTFDGAGSISVAGPIAEVKSDHNRVARRNLCVTTARDRSITSLKS